MASCKGPICNLQFTIYLVYFNLSSGEWNQHGGVLLMGYELFRLLSTVVPSLSSSKSMATKKKKAPTPTEKMNGEPEVIDLDEEEKHMELLIG